MTPRRFLRLPRSTRAYIAAVTVAGSATIVHSFVQLYLHNIPRPWAILALLTLVSGSATVTLHALPAVVSGSEPLEFPPARIFRHAAGALTFELNMHSITL